MRFYPCLLIILVSAIIWTNSRNLISFQQESLNISTENHQTETANLHSSPKILTSTTNSLGSTTAPSLMPNISFLNRTIVQQADMAKRYKLWPGFHCGGISIKQWSDRTNSEYGKISNISICKEICDVHDECAGFVHRTTDKICSFWKKAPFKPVFKRNRNCYEKQEGCTCSRFVNINGFGKCRFEGGWNRQGYSNEYHSSLRGGYKDNVFCFVNQASTCPDLLHSVKPTEVSQQLSAEACRDDRNVFGFLRLEGNKRCKKRDDNVLHSFIPATSAILDISAARSECERYCNEDERCWGCSVSCLRSCKFNAIHECGDLEDWTGLLKADVTVKTVCIDIHIQVIKTLAKGWENIKWSLGPCSSAQSYNEHNDAGYPTYIERCCLTPGKYVLICDSPKATTFWYLGIEGHRFCNEFVDYEAFEKVIVSTNEDVMEKQNNKYCPLITQYLHRNSLDTALKDCRNDDNCKAIYGVNCENTGAFALCRSTENIGTTNIGSCIYKKKIELECKDTLPEGYGPEKCDWDCIAWSGGSGGNGVDYCDYSWFGLFNCAQNETKKVKDFCKKSCYSCDNAITCPKGEICYNQYVLSLSWMRGRIAECYDRCTSILKCTGFLHNMKDGACHLYHERCQPKMISGKWDYYNIADCVVEGSKRQNGLNSSTTIMVETQKLVCPKNVRYVKGLDTCYCEEHCTWKMCFITHPPKDCLIGTGFGWTWSSTKTCWIARYSDLKEQGIKESSIQNLSEPEDKSNLHAHRIRTKSNGNEWTKQIQIETAKQAAVIGMLIVTSTFAVLYLCHSPENIMASPGVLKGRIIIIFKLACFFLAGYMAVTQICRFIENQDTSSISFKRFNRTPKDKYPTFSLCFEGTEFHWYHNMEIFNDHELSAKNFDAYLKGKTVCDMSTTT